MKNGANLLRSRVINQLKISLEAVVKSTQCFSLYFFTFQGCSTLWLSLRSLTVCLWISKLCQKHYETLVRNNLTLLYVLYQSEDGKKQVPNVRILWNSIQHLISNSFCKIWPQMPSERFLFYSWKILHFLSRLSCVNVTSAFNFPKFFSFVA